MAPVDVDSDVIPVVVSEDVQDSQFDCVIVVTDKIDNLKVTAKLSCLHATLEKQAKIDGLLEKAVSLIPCDAVPSKRLVFAPTGPLNRDYDDVRRFQEAAAKGIKRALSAGCVYPLLVQPKDDAYPLAMRVAILGALSALHVPLELREFSKEKSTKAETLGVWVDSVDAGVYVTNIARILETGRHVYRDIGGSDPERMAPPRVAEYVENLFKDDPKVKVEVVSDLQKLEKEYPLLVAVNRAAKGVERHQARVIFLEYTGEGKIDETLMLVGKGITYDTGGADVKVGGAMRGMHRDKCGSAFVAGFFKVLSMWQPVGLKVKGVMCVVRNSIGSESYVADEIIVSRAGKRIRIGNTDAEGRMVMADLLCEMKEKAVNEVNPHLFTIATLTGHVCRAYGANYTAVMENGPAHDAQTAKKISDAGEKSGDPFEISTIRREDYEAHAGQTECDDVLQSGGSPSTMTARGHQSPAAFLIMASGLDAHGKDSSNLLKYCHVDIAGSSGPWPGVPTGAPMVAMSHAFVLNRNSTNLGFPGNHADI